jgi:hypothetical protein
MLAAVRGTGRSAAPVYPDGSPESTQRGVSRVLLLERQNTTFGGCASLSSKTCCNRGATNQEHLDKLATGGRSANRGCRSNTSVRDLCASSKMPSTFYEAQSIWLRWFPRSGCALRPPTRFTRDLGFLRNIGYPAPQAVACLLDNSHDRRASQRTVLALPSAGGKGS